MPASPITNRTPPVPSSRPSIAARPRANSPSRPTRRTSTPGRPRAFCPMTSSFFASWAMSPRSNEDRTGDTSGLQPSGSIHRVTSRSVLDALACSHRTQHNKAGFDPHPDAQVDSIRATRQGISALPDVANDAQASLHCALGVILMGCRRSKQGKHSVACKVRDSTAETLNGGNHPRNRAADDDPHIFGIQSFAKSCRSDDICGQHRHGPTLFSQPPRRSLPHVHIVALATPRWKARLSATDLRGGPPPALATACVVEVDRALAPAIEN